MLADHISAGIVGGNHIGSGVDRGAARQHGKCQGKEKEVFHGAGFLDGKLSGTSVLASLWNSRKHSTFIVPRETTFWIPPADVSMFPIYPDISVR